MVKMSKIIDPYKINKYQVNNKFKIKYDFLLILRYTIFKDHITLIDYEIHDGMNLELYYQWIQKKRMSERKQNDFQSSNSILKILFFYV